MAMQGQWREAIGQQIRRDAPSVVIITSSDVKGVCFCKASEGPRGIGHGLSNPCPWCDDSPTSLTLA